MKKLSDRVPDFPMTFWLKELAQLVEKTGQQLDFVDERERATADRQDRLLNQLSEHIDVLMDAEAERIEAKGKPSDWQATRDAIVEQGWGVSANIAPADVDPQGNVVVAFYRVIPFIVYRGRATTEAEATRLAAKRWLDAQELSSG